jgi:hypothetical protein
MLRRILGLLLLVSPVLAQQPAPWFEELKSGLADFTAKAGGNEDQRFEKFLERCWNYKMRDNPEDATFVGFPGQNSINNGISASSRPPVSRVYGLE